MNTPTPLPPDLERGTPFVEAECEIGGCGCATWDDWYWAAVERAKNTPEWAEACQQLRDGVISEADADDCELDLTEAEIAHRGHLHLAPLCNRPTCPRFGGRP